MKPIKINAIAKATKAIDYSSALRFEEINNVQFDSREVTLGSLFVPLQGERDGHDFIQAAILNGVTAALWSRPMSEAPEGIAIIQVEDTLVALQELAKAYLKEINPKVVAITGSSGKTTTKDMTAAALGESYRVHKTAGNYNNHIGVPMTILSMPEDTSLLVLEMGMNHEGEISALSKLAEPDVAVITMIGENHIGFLGSRENIASAKFEIVDGLKENGILIYPGDEPLILERIPSEHPFQTITFGLTEEQDIYAYDIQSLEDSTIFSINLSPTVEMSVPILGSFNVSNALAACAIAYSQGMSMEQIADRLAHFELTKNRMEWLNGINNTRVLNDAYNASPTSMKAVIKTFSNITIEETSRRILVLGDMLELGVYSEELHASIADAIDPEKIDAVYLFGPSMHVLYKRLEGQIENLFYYQDDRAGLTTHLKEELQEKDYVLIKSSFGTDLLSLAKELEVKVSE